MDETGMWAIIATLLSFAFSFVLMQKKIPFGISLLAGSALLGLLTLSIPTLVESIVRTVLDPVTIELVVTTALISSLGFLYEITDKLSAMTDNLEKIVSDKRAIAMAIPALFGTLPVYGGALISAPFIKAEGEKMGMGNGKSAFVNLWFRHVFHFMWPLIPPLIFIAYLSGVSVSSIAIRGLPAVIVGVLLGFVLGLRNVTSIKQKMSINRESIGSVLQLISPIAIAVFLTLAFGVKTFISVAIGICVLIVISKPSFSSLVSVFRRKELIHLALAATAAMIFKNVVQYSQLPQTIVDLTQSTSTPWLLLLIAIPLTLGVLIGDHTTPVVISVPILTAIASLNPSSANIVFISGYIGYFISPLHLCLVVSNEYFKTRVLDVYRLLLPAALSVLIVSIAFSAPFI
jgi:integral membrane protein (TIGR00529 family)